MNPAKIRRWGSLCRFTLSDISVGWFQKQATYSLELIRSTGVSHTASVIDVGGGASVLVDDLLAEGYVNLTILDISQTALATSKIRLGSRATNVRWIEMDITKANLPYEVFDIWHDRAVFHFLVTPEDREEYVSCVLRSVKPGGHVIGLPPGNRSASMLCLRLIK